MASTEEFTFQNYLEKWARLLYIIPPSTTFEKVEDIPSPDFIEQTIPYFLTLIVLEYVVQWWKNDVPKTRINDGITSLSAGAFMLLKDLLVRGSAGWAYIYIYENFRLFELPWDSPYTWYAAALLGDLSYYWAHRAGHEINLFWALHQVHHSAEDYNLTTALRQSGFQSWFTWIFYLPAALFLPPPLFLIHQQFNTIYQFWIHTEVIDNLGPLEYILNTPKHHRVHHGCNRYCLDKNYAGVLIIWDRLFGTFQDELPGQTTYGLVEDVHSFNPMYLQFFYFGKIWQKAKSCVTIPDKLSAVFKGPGWFPGLDRLGDPTGVAEFPNRARYDPKIPTWQSVYVLLHFILVTIVLQIFTQHEASLKQSNVIIFAAVMFYTLTSIGFILDGKKIGILTEIVRCFGAVLFLTKSRNSVEAIQEYDSTTLFLLLFFSISLFSFSLFEIVTLTRKVSAQNTHKIEQD